MSESTFVPSRITPTDEQQLVQTTRARHVLVEANAGAAKTTSLALRIAQALQRGADPSMILALTYTAPAVQALRSQLRFIGVPASAINAMHIHTFESFSGWLLARIEGSGVLELHRQEQVKPYVLRAIERAQSLPEERHWDELALGSASSALVEGLLKSFAVIKGRMLIEEQAMDSRMTPELAEELGFDYLTMRVRTAYEFIRRGGHPDRPAFRFEGDATYDLARALAMGELAYDDTPFALGLALIVVDEMHDTNRAMFTILKALLAGNPRAAFVGVGDRDQVIHSQAGAEAGFMHEHFAAEIGVPTRLPLTASHRFGPRLAQAAGALARKPYASAQAFETEIRHLHGESHRVMARLIAVAAREHMGQEQHDELRILLRQPAHSILIERELLNIGVDYGTQGFQAFLQRREILLLRGLHAYCVDDYAGFANKEIRAAVLDALMLFAGSLVESAELRDVDDVTAQRRGVDEASSHPRNMRAFIEGQVFRNASAPAMKRLRAAMAVLATDELSSFNASFLKALDPQGLAAAVLVRREDIKQVQDNLAALLELAQGEACASLGEFFRLLHTLDASRQQRARRNRRVMLSSIEAAKGLEFDHVIIPHLTRGEFTGEVSVAENRNLLYVAMTRARQRLTLAFNPQRPSRFLQDASLLPAHTS